MKYGKWIGGVLGWTLSGPIGGVLGFALGSLFDKASDSASTVFKEGIGSEAATSSTRGDFVVSLLVLIAAVMKADGKILKSELDFAKQFLIQNFGLEKASEAVKMLGKMVKQEIPVNEVCNQIRYNLDYSSRLQLMHFIFGLARADGKISGTELQLIERMSVALGLNKQDFISIKAMFVDETDSAYKILEIDSSATIDEIKKAYRKMAVKYHPDKVSHLGEDVQNAAKEKFQKVNDAYEKIKTERNFN